MIRARPRHGRKRRTRPPLRHDWRVVGLATPRLSTLVDGALAQVLAEGGPVSVETAAEPASLALHQLQADDPEGFQATMAEALCVALNVRLAALEDAGALQHMGDGKYRRKGED